MNEALLMISEKEEGAAMGAAVEEWTVRKQAERR